MIDKEYFIYGNESVDKAFKKLNKNLIGTLIVVDESMKLVGIITDGDIRRALLKHNNTELKCSEIANKDCKYVDQFTDKKKIRSLAQAYRVIPIVDETNKLIDFYSFKVSSRIPVSSPEIRGNEIKYVIDCFETNWISSQGSYVTKFENEFSEYVGKPFCLSVCNGTVALELALKSLDIGKGDEVIIPTFTFGATANAVLNCGADIVFIDVCKDTWLADVDLVRKAISPKTKAIIVVDIYGNPYDIKSLREKCDVQNIKIISDSAEAVGARVDNQHTGHDADIATFSFFANKLITTGEGGMVAFNDEEIFIKAKSIRDHGMDPNRRYFHIYQGSNSRMTNIQAAIGLAQLEQINLFLKLRNNIYKKYNDALEYLSCTSFQFIGDTSIQSPWLYAIQIEDRDIDKIVSKLEQKKIDSRRFFQPLDSMPPFKKYKNFLNGNAQEIFSKGLCLPTFTSMTDNEIDYVATELVKILNKK